MRQLLAAAFMALTCTLVPPAMAQEQGPAVPIEKAPYHLPVFTNEYVAVLKLGEFYWQDPGVTRAVRNSGTTRVEVVKFELK
jgi:hypothetical protein